jgi:hypothetical protein
MLAILPSFAGGQTRVEPHRQCYQKLAAFCRCLAPSALVSVDASNLAELRRGTDTSRVGSAFDEFSAALGIATSIAFPQENLTQTDHVRSHLDELVVFHILQCRFQE